MVLRIRGRALPTGEPIDLYADGDRWTTEPVANAELVSDGGWILPGLVDSHTHPGADEPGAFGVSGHRGRAGFAYGLVQAGGVDSIEHGQFLDPALVDQMAHQGTAFTPTLAIFTEHAHTLAGVESNPRRDRFLAGYDLMRRSSAAAAEAGVTILAGRVRSRRAYRPPRGCGFRSRGAPADAVVYERDPRRPGRPSRVLLRGRVAR